MISRRTPLKRSSTPLKRTPLRRCSKKHAKELRTYSKLRQEFLACHPHCEITRDNCTGRATDVHHVKKRGVHLNDARHFLATCRSCHDWCHQNPSISRLLGYLQ